MTKNVVGYMREDIPLHVDNLNTSLDVIENQIKELDTQIDALTNDICAVVEREMTEYLINTKLPVLKISLSADHISFGLNYGPPKRTTLKITYDGTNATVWSQYLISDTTKEDIPDRKYKKLSVEFDSSSGDSFDDFVKDETVNISIIKTNVHGTITTDTTSEAVVSVTDLEDQVMRYNPSNIDEDPGDGYISFGLDSTSIGSTSFIHVKEIYINNKNYYGQDISGLVGTFDDAVNIISTNITDWVFKDEFNHIVYSLNVNFDNDPYILRLIEKFEFTIDYLTREYTTGATYGLLPSRNALVDAKKLLIENKEKINNSLDIFEDYE